MNAPARRIGRVIRGLTRRVRAAVLAAASAALCPWGAAAQAPLPPSPYDAPGGRSVTINGQAFSRNVVFRFLPVTLPLANIRVTSLYGARLNPFGGHTHEDHKGVDFGSPLGTPVHSTAAGRVVAAESQRGYGLLVDVQHGLGFMTRYAHLDRVLVRPGDVLDRNAVVGTVGNGGRSTGPHLHYEIWKDGARLDPVEFVLQANKLYRHLE